MFLVIILIPDKWTEFDWWKNILISSITTKNLTHNNYLIQSDWKNFWLQIHSKFTTYIFKTKLLWCLKGIHKKICILQLKYFSKHEQFLKGFQAVFNLFNIHDPTIIKILLPTLFMFETDIFPVKRSSFVINFCFNSKVIALFSGS